MANEKPLILLVDDDEGVREALGEYIKMEGFEVNTAANGREALTMLNANADIRLVITDIMMPVMDGLELLRQVLLLPRKIPVVMITGFSDVSREEAIRRGAAQLIAKPFSLDELKKVIATCLPAGKS